MRGPRPVAQGTMSLDDVEPGDIPLRHRRAPSARAPSRAIASCGRGRPRITRPGSAHRDPPARSAFPASERSPPAGSMRFASSRASSSRASWRTATHPTMGSVASKGRARVHSNGMKVDSKSREKGRGRGGKAVRPGDAADASRERNERKDRAGMCAPGRGYPYLRRFTSATPATTATPAPARAREPSSGVG